MATYRTRGTCNSHSLHAHNAITRQHTTHRHTEPAACCLARPGQTRLQGSTNGCSFLPAAPPQRRYSPPNPTPIALSRGCLEHTATHAHTHEYCPDHNAGQLQHQQRPRRPPDATPDTPRANCVRHSSSWPAVGQVRGWLQGCLLGCMTHTTSACCRLAF